ncbi:MAG: RnfABCDGE type electron transport complex subunit B [Ruminococcus sp.]|jgi:RnfABCDGE-type electron transport complex B subunit|nr:RnfABCDGE type electron transport complex subunit B [Ruminococcus sp.]
METALIFAGLGLLAGVLLTVASKLFEVKVDERVIEITAALPGVNCGSCGFAGCSDYAEAVAGGASPNLCKPGGQESADIIAGIMGIASGKIEAMTAVVHCNGSCNVTEKKFDYKGVQSCKAANRFYNGSESCTYGCLAYGDCVKVCPETAISIIDRLAVIDKTRCIGCGMCAKVCPDGIIKLRPLGFDYDVACSSHDSGKFVRTACKAGCIACKICEKNCPEGAIKVEDNLAVIDYDKCTSCGLCADKCPAKVIKKCG